MEPDIAVMSSCDGADAVEGGARPAGGGVTLRLLLIRAAANRSVKPLWGVAVSLWNAQTRREMPRPIRPKGLGVLFGPQN